MNVTIKVTSVEIAQKRDGTQLCFRATAAQIVDAIPLEGEAALLAELKRREAERLEESAECEVGS